MKLDDLLYKELLEQATTLDDLSPAAARALTKLVIEALLEEKKTTRILRDALEIQLRLVAAALAENNDNEEKEGNENEEQGNEKQGA